MGRTTTRKSSQSLKNPSPTKKPRRSRRLAAREAVQLPPDVTDDQTEESEEVDESGYYAEVDEPDASPVRQRIKRRKARRRHVEPISNNEARIAHQVFQLAPFNNAMRKIYDQKPKVNQHGRSSESVTPRHPRSFKDSLRIEQFLNHLATTFKESTDILTHGESEVQVALVNHKYIIISTNKPQSAKDLYLNIATNSASTVADQFCARARCLRNNWSNSKAKYAFSHARKVGKLINTLTPPHRRHDELSDQCADLIETLGKAAAETCQKFDIDNDGEMIEFKEFCEGNESDQRVAFLTGNEKMHAEQRILLALCLANVERSLSVQICGTFRPCRGCFESLNFVKRFYLTYLEFGNYPGNYFPTSTNKTHARIVEVLAKAGKVPVKQYLKLMTNNYRLEELTQETYTSIVRTAQRNHSKTNWLTPHNEPANHPWASESDSDDSNIEE